MNQSEQFINETVKHSTKQRDNFGFIAEFCRVDSSLQLQYSRNQLGIDFGDNPCQEDRWLYRPSWDSPAETDYPGHRRKPD